VPNPVKLTACSSTWQLATCQQRCVTSQLVSNYVDIHSINSVSQVNLVDQKELFIPGVPRRQKVQKCYQNNEPMSVQINVL